VPESEPSPPAFQTPSPPVQSNYNQGSSFSSSQADNTYIPPPQNTFTVPAKQHQQQQQQPRRQQQQQQQQQQFSPQRQQNNFQVNIDKYFDFGATTFSLTTWHCADCRNDNPGACNKIVPLLLVVTIYWLQQIH